MFSFRPADRALAACLLLAACAPEGAPPPARGPDSAIEVRDASGRAVRLDRPARRIVSLVPSVTRTLEALGARDVLAARTDFDTAGWAAGLPSVGGGLDPSIEAVVAADPDVVIRFAGAQDARTPERLDALGIPHVAVRPERVGDVLDIVRLLGRLTGRESVADSLARALAAELDEVRRARTPGAPPRVAYVLGGEPPWVAGPGTYIDELIELAGGTNAFQDLDAAYAPVSPEELAARDLDVVLLPRGARLDRRLAPGARVVEVSGEVEIPGPGVGKAARELAWAVRGGGGHVR